MRRHCGEIVGELKMRYQHGFMTIGAEISGKAPIWQFTYVAGDREATLRWLSRALDSIDPDWPQLLTVD